MFGNYGDEAKERKKRKDDDDDNNNHSSFFFVYALPGLFAPLPNAVRLYPMACVFVLV